MLFNRQESLDVNVPEEVIIYFVDSKIYGSYYETLLPYCNSYRTLTETISLLAVAGVKNFNIVIYNDRQESGFLVNLLNNLFTQRIQYSRVINYTITNDSLEKSTDILRTSELPKIFIVSQLYKLLREIDQSTNINSLLATEINDNSYFIATDVMPFIIKGQSDKLFANFLAVAKTYFNSPIPALISTGDTSILEGISRDLDESTIAWLNESIDRQVRRFTDIKANGIKSEIKQFTNLMIAHELIAPVLVNMLVKPDKFSEGQLVIIKKLLNAFFLKVVEELNMSPKASPTLNKTIAKLFEDLQTMYEVHANATV